MRLALVRIDRRLSRSALVITTAAALMAGGLAVADPAIAVPAPALSSTATPASTAPAPTTSATATTAAPSTSAGATRVSPTTTPATSPTAASAPTTASAPATGPAPTAPGATGAPGTGSQKSSTGATSAAATAGTPFGAYSSLTATSTGVSVTGWAVDPATTGAIKVFVKSGGRALGTLVAGSPRPDVGKAHPSAGPNHGFSGRFALPSGTRSVCLVALNIGTGANRFLGCRSVLVLSDPIGGVDAAQQSVGGVVVTGWALDLDSTASVWVRVTDNGVRSALGRARLTRTDIAASYPGTGTHRGYVVAAPITSAGAHHVCVTAYNVGQGLSPSVSLGCRDVTVKVNPVGLLHAIPTRVLGATTMTVDGWAVDPQTNDPVSIHLSLDGHTPISIRAAANLPGLKVAYLGVNTMHAFRFTFKVNSNAHKVCAVAYNLLAGKNLNLGCKTTPALVPPIGPVTSPALISTSRYIRNINGGSGDAAKTRAMGATDALHNPSNHRYLTLLQIGGQTTTGIVLSATSTYITYAEAVSALKAYVDGYAASQQFNAPATIAVGTNNDIDVRGLTGQIWAQRLINPLRAYAAKYRNITIAGANDIEPGFIGTMAASKSWVSGFLGATTAKFVFNGSADGCGWTSPGSRCNNGWTAAGLAWMSGGAAPTRIVSLPQIYNYTMPQQWKYISMTNVVSGVAKINFGGPLTEWTACYTQGGGCGSLSNNNAWAALWAQLQSDARVRQGSMPYGTDLRIN